MVIAPLRSTRWTRWLGPLSLAISFAALAAWSWRKWPDVQIDFGNQLYLPWQLTRGRALYRDIDYGEGPLSLYANAALFELFGASLRTLIFANLALLAALTALLYALFARACGAFTATVCCLVLLVVFAFAQYGDIGNYNYITPYTHEQTHGLILGVVAIACLARYLERGSLRWVAAAGVSLGLVFLTKAELFVPAAAAVAVGSALGAAAAARSGSGVGPGARAAAWLVAGMLVPPAVCFALLARVMPAEVAARGIAGNWGRLGAGIFDNPFYLEGLGLDDVAGNLNAIAGVSAAVVALAAAAIAVDRLLARAGGTPRLLAPALGIAATAALIAAGDAIAWPLVGRALAPAAGLGALAAVALALRVRSSAEVARPTLLAMWAVFAFVLLAKMILATRIWHYGFTLAMPATLLLVACLVWLVPALARARGGHGGFARALLLAPIAACAAFFFAWSSYQYGRKHFAVASGADTFFAENSDYDPRAGLISAAVEELRPLMPADATLLVLPEGTMLNWLLRRSSPSRYTLFIPPSIAFAGGEQRMLEDLRAHPPDFIALLHRDTAEYGVGYFGADPHYGRAIRDWVLRNYTRVGRVGAEPFEGPRYGVALLRRNSPDGANREAHSSSSLLRAGS